MVAANVGTFFEWFDLLVYAMFAITISRLFFPTGNPQSALLYSLLTFASAYVVRPVGAVVLGIFADKRGRRAALTVAAFLMLCGTFLMAVIPTYRVIGAWAPALLVFGRLLQGFSVGGEFGCANSYLTEQNPRTKALFASLQFSTSGFAVLTASLFAYVINHYLSPEQVDSWGWRMPFIFGCLIGPVGLYIRTKINETHEFEEVADKAHRPLAETFKFHKRYLLIGAAVVAAGNVASFLNIYMPTFAINNLGIAKDSAFIASIFSGLVSTIFPIFGGLAADRFGTIKVMRIASGRRTDHRLPDVLRADAYAFVQVADLVSVRDVAGVLQLLLRAGRLAVVTTLPDVVPHDRRIDCVCRVADVLRRHYAPGGRLSYRADRQHHVAGLLRDRDRRGCSGRLVGKPKPGALTYTFEETPWV